MVTASSIGATKAGGYARYLESKTVRSDRGDYYLTPDGEPAQAPGRWLASADTLAQLGIEGATVKGGQLSHSWRDDTLRLAGGFAPREQAAGVAAESTSRSAHPSPCPLSGLSAPTLTTAKKSRRLTPPRSRRR